MLWKCCTQYTSKFGKLSSGHRTGKGQFSLQSQRRSEVKWSEVTQSCQTLCNPMDCNMPGFPVYHQLLELTQTNVHWVSDAIQPPHPLLSPSPPNFKLSQLLDFIPIPKKGNAKECSNYHTIAFISHASKVMLKFSKPGFNSTWTVNFQMVKLDLEKSEEPEINLPTSIGSSKSIRVFSNESVLHIRWPKYWRFSFGISPSNQYSGRFPLGWTGRISLQSKGLSRVFSNTTCQKHQFFSTQLSLWSNSHIHTWPLEKP